MHNEKMLLLQGFYMNFKFNVEATDEISSAKIYILEGTLQEGMIMENAQAIAVIDGDQFPITIKNIVFINRTAKAMKAQKLTLNIECPSFNIKSLEGISITG